MPEVTVERRNSLRHAMVLAVEVIELPRRAKLSARTSDISRTGCYVDTLNPIPQGSRARIRFTHHQEEFEAMGSVVYVSQGLGMALNSQKSHPNNRRGWISGWKNLRGNSDPAVICRLSCRKVALLSSLAL
jgi:hypothetical protein